MCRSKMATRLSTPTTPRTPRVPSPPSSSASHSAATTFKLSSSAATSSTLSRTSLSSLRSALPETPHLYTFPEIRLATNNFLSKPTTTASLSSSSWRCTLRSKDVLLFRRKLRRPISPEELMDRLSVLYRSHHMSIIKLLGVSLSPSSDHVYLAYDFVVGASLADCLRNRRNPNFTVLSTWMSRMQVAADLADGLDYIHNNTGIGSCHVHKHIKSSSIIITEPGFNAKICHFGAAELCGEIGEERGGRRENGRNAVEIEGVMGYMAPELGTTGIATQKSDVYAFGVVILELLSGEEPVRYKFDRASGDYKKISVIEAAESAVDGEEAALRLRKWIDKRLRDSFPVEAVKILVQLALECVNIDPDKRPDMRRVAGKISKLFLQSEAWCNRVKVPTEISVSLAPR